MVPWGAIRETPASRTLIILTDRVGYRRVSFIRYPQFYVCVPLERQLCVQHTNSNLMVKNTRKTRKTDGGKMPILVKLRHLSSVLTAHAPAEPSQGGKER